MKNILITLLLILNASVLVGQTSDMYMIDVSIPELRDSSLFLAYHYGDKQYIRDTIKLDINGKGTFSGNEALPLGIYMIVLPENRYFEILINENQHFSLSCSFPEYSESLKFQSSPENSSFIEYQKKWSMFQMEANNLARRRDNNRNNNDSLSILTNMMTSKEQEMKDYLHEVVNENQTNLLAALVKSIIPIDIPEPHINQGANNPDSIRWYFRYNYNKDHYFDNIDLTDDRLLRTPILHTKLETFFSNIVIQSPDSINKEIERIIKKCESSYDVFQYVSVYLFNRYRSSEIMGHDAILLRIAEDIYLSGRANWVSEEFLADLEREIELLRNNLIGMKGKDLIMDSFKNIYVSLYDIDKEFTILYFWEPNCGFCTTTTPKLAEYYNNAKDEGVEVFAVCTTDDKQEWSDYIEANGITWINGWDPDRASHFDYYYNVQSTPMIYVLDREKNIIAKKLSVDDIPGFIDNYRTYN